MLQSAHADVAFADLEVARTEPDLTIGSRQFLRPSLRIPLHREPGQMPRELREVDPVIAPVGRSAWHELHRAAGHGPRNDVGEITHAIVLGIAADVEDL